MKTTKILASTVISLAFLAAGSAFAGDHDYAAVTAPATTSTVTRAQVQAELAQAQKEGTLLNAGDDSSYPTTAQSGVSKSRAEVRAELMQARKSGTLPDYQS